MSILLTGASSFLGKKIISYNTNLSFDTLGRSVENTYGVDICKPFPYFNKKYDYVIHIAGKAHDNGKSKIVSNKYFETNYLGTLNLLNALEQSEVKNFIYISSVAVYGLYKGILVNEDSGLNATDPYGLSKLQAESAVIEWCKKNEVKSTILRLPLVIGSEAPGNLKSMIRGIQKGYYFNVDGGRAKKSMVLVDDIAKNIFHASKFGGIYNLTDGVHPSFYQLSTYIASQLNKKQPLNIPLWLAKILSFFGDIIGDKAPINSLKLVKINSDLTFDDSLARNTFDWNPSPVLLGFKLSD